MTLQDVYKAMPFIMFCLQQYFYWCFFYRNYLWGEGSFQNQWLWSICYSCCAVFQIRKQHTVLYSTLFACCPNEQNHTRFAANHAISSSAKSPSPARTHLQSWWLSITKVSLVFFSSSNFWCLIVLNWTESKFINNFHKTYDTQTFLGPEHNQIY